MRRPYSISSRKTFAERRAYEEHTKMIKHPRKKVDNSAPKLPANTYIKLGILEADASRLTAIESENRQLIKRLNIVGRSKPRVKPVSILKNTNFGERKYRNKQIERDNRELFFILQNVESKYNKEDFLLDYQRLKDKIQTQSYQERKLDAEEWTLAPKGIDLPLDSSQRIRCYFDIGFKNVKRTIGRIVMEIWMDIAPVAGCNFVNLCKGYDNFCYKDTPFHSIFKGIFCIGGDVVNKSGTGIYSVYNGINSTFSDENVTLEFNGPGVLAAHSIFPGDNHSQFLITFNELTTMNKHFVVFGRVVGDQRALYLLEGFGTKGGAPIKPIQVCKCGILDGVLPPSPKSIKLPSRISPASSEENVSLITEYEKMYSKPKVVHSDFSKRKTIIKEWRKQMKEMGVPSYKLNMPSNYKNKIDCTKL